MGRFAEDQLIARIILFPFNHAAICSAKAAALISYDLSKFILVHYFICLCQIAYIIFKFLIAYHSF